jgi:hypothetical protein
MGVPTTKSLPLEPLVESSRGSINPGLAEIDGCGIGINNESPTPVYQLAHSMTTELSWK